MAKKLKTYEVIVAMTVTKYHTFEVEELSMSDARAEAFNQAREFDWYGETMETDDTPFDLNIVGNPKPMEG